MEESLCIVAIVERGKADKVVQEAKKAGANGATILYGRGTGEHEAMRFFDIQIESSKEVILVVVEREKYEPVFETMIRAGKLKEPGKGIIFTFPIDNLVGLRHRA
ncbi:MAG TPA: P-II family nitrogen regulator [Clostridia bacterium]|jgi:nitrogen regulatory protein P-II 1|nr:P-II family nitrogen regulator [Clostridia bacterium]HHY06128.1 P-II family nitrogen regulator [Clostridia bacterium]